MNSEITSTLCELQPPISGADVQLTCLFAVSVLGHLPLWYLIPAAPLLL